MRNSTKNTIADIVCVLEKVTNELISVTDFCDIFSSLFNIDLDKSTTEINIQALNELFNVVIWYSPYPDERSTIPNYVDENTVIEAAETALKIIKT